VPIPPLAEIHVALEGAAADVTRLEGYALKMLMRSATVATTDNRKGGLLPSRNVTRRPRRFSQSRAIALDMESATIAANGFRFCVPYGTLLCVSDKPLHGEIKLPGMANIFYREQVAQHLCTGMRATERLRDAGIGKLRSSGTGGVSVGRRPARSAGLIGPVTRTATSVGSWGMACFSTVIGEISRSVTHPRGRSRPTHRE
jgi:hypothetical protein